MTHSTGIYQIRNTTNGKTYVGSTVSFEKRWALHTRQLSRGTHHTQGLQRAWNKYGAEAFVFEPLLVCSRDMLLFYEQRAIDQLRPRYNSARVAGSTLGLKMSAEARANISRAQTGKKLSAEHRAKLSEKLTGRPVSAKALAVLRGNKGRKHSEETIEKNRLAHIGFVHSPEARAKLSAANKGRVFTEEHRAKLSAAASARAQPLQSEETRARRSASLLAYYAKRRAGGVL